MSIPVRCIWLVAPLLLSALAVACGSGTAGGGLIAYVVSAGDAPLGGFDIYLANADGTGRHRLTESGASGSPAWSPDGRKIAFDCAGPTDGMYTCVVNSDGSNRHRLTARFADHPAWSPDGKTIAAHCGFQICLFGPDGKAFRMLTHVEGEEIFGELLWSPDSKSIAVSRVGEFARTELVVNAADGRMSEVAHGAEVEGWTPDGRLVLAGGAGPHAMYTVNLDGSERHPLGADERVVGPQWSPDGQRLLRDGPPQGAEMLPRKLFVVDREGKLSGTVASVGRGSYLLESAWQPAH